MDKKNLDNGCMFTLHLTPIASLSAIFALIWYQLKYLGIDIDYAIILTYQTKYIAFRTQSL